MKKPERFILVDDDPANNMICKFIIKRVLKNADVETFEVPESGLEYIEKNYINNASLTPTILLLDINMPSISGWQFLDFFNNYPPEVKGCISIYILSSSVDDRDKERARNNTNVKGYIAKPLSNEILNEILNGVNSNESIL